MEQLVMSWLEDEESRYIFKNRLAYNKESDLGYIRNIIDRYLPELKDFYWYPNKENEFIDDVQKQIKADDKVWVWGGGTLGQKIIKKLNNLDIKISGIIDRDSRIKELFGTAVFQADKVDFRDIDCLIVSMYNKEAAESCVSHAVTSGMNRDNVIIYREYCCITLDEQQYFEKFVKFDEGEVFIDAGVLDLATSLQFVKECEKNHVSDYKIYAFEPDRVSYERCLEIKRQYPNVKLELFNSGLWSSNMKIGFTGEGEAGSRILNDNALNTIDTVSLDSVVKDKVTFIKMDIEGAELEALKGSQNIIKQYRPKLAVCVYHKREDIIEIPRYIKSLVPEYHLYLRHYSSGVTETVLYAIP